MIKSTDVEESGKLIREKVIKILDVKLTNKIDIPQKKFPCKKCGKMITTYCPDCRAAEQVKNGA